MPRRTASIGAHQRRADEFPVLTRLRHLTGPRYGWLVGLPVLGLGWAVAISLAAPRLEQALESSSAAIVAAETGAAPEPWLRVSASGRDLVAKGEPPGPDERDGVLARLAALPGARSVHSDLSLIQEVSPFVWTATRGESDAIALSGSRPAEIGRAALAALVTAELPATTSLSDEARAARGAPPGFPAAAAFALSRLRSLAKGATATLNGTVIEIRGEAISVSAYDALRTAFADPPRGYSFGRLDILPPTVADPRFVVESSAGGGLVLTGFVPSEPARTAIRALAAETADGAFVDDRTQTARGVPGTPDAEALARFALRLAALLRRGEVRFENGRMAVTGDALDSQARDEIAAAMKQSRPDGIGAGALSIAVPPLSPYTIAIRREADSVVLSGHLPDTATRERLLAALQPRFFRERIVDRTRLAEGAPAGLAQSIEAAIPSLATLASGEIAVADSSLSLTGESLYRESAARLGERLPAMLPAAWTSRVAVESRDALERRDGETCKRQFAAETSGAPLVFEPGSALLRAAFYPKLDAIAALAKACPDLRIAVAGHRDPPGTKLSAANPSPEFVVPATASIAKPSAKTATRASPAKAKAPAKTTQKPAAKAKAVQAKPAAVKAETPKTPSAPAKHAAKDAAKDATKAGPARTTPPAATNPVAVGAAGAAPESAKVADKAVVATEKAAEPDLARQRASAILDYLLSAGIPMDRIVLAEATAPGDAGVLFELRPSIAAQGNGPGR